MSQPCSHGLLYCAYCIVPGTYTETELDDLDGPKFPPKPARSWGGPHTVSVMGKDDKPVQIPPAMQYAWCVKGREDAAARIVAWAYARIPKVVKRYNIRQPDTFEREDLAQDAALAFMEYLLEIPQAEATSYIEALSGPIDKENAGAYKLAFCTTKAVRKWNRDQMRAPDMLSIDDVTGLAYGPVERWADKGTYLPLMTVLRKAQEAEHKTSFQAKLLEVWDIFDPERVGRFTRTGPLTDVERKRLSRFRSAFGEGEPDEVAPLVITDEVRNEFLAAFG